MCARLPSRGKSNSFCLSFERAAQAFWWWFILILLVSETKRNALPDRSIERAVNNVCRATDRLKTKWTSIEIEAMPCAYMSLLVRGFVDIPIKQRCFVKDRMLIDFLGVVSQQRKRRKVCCREVSDIVVAVIRSEAIAGEAPSIRCRPHSQILFR